MKKNFVLLMMLFISCLFVFAQQSLQELEQNGWAFDSQPDIEGLGFLSKVHFLVLINNNDIYYDDPENFYSNVSSQFKFYRHIFNNDGSLNYTSEESYEYELGLLKIVNWEVDSIKQTSVYEYDINRRIISYSVYDNTHKSYNFYEKYNYFNNYIIVSDINNKIQKVIINNKTDFGYRITIYKEKKKNTLIDFNLQDNKIIKISRLLYVGATPSGSEYTLEYQGDKITKMIRKSLVNNKIIYDKYYKYENEILVEVNDKALNQVIALSDFTDEGNWRKKVLSRNGIKEAIFIRKF